MAASLARLEVSVVGADRVVCGVVCGTMKMSSSGREKLVDVVEVRLP